MSASPPPGDFNPLPTCRQAFLAASAPSGQSNPPPIVRLPGAFAPLAPFLPRLTSKPQPVPPNAKHNGPRKSNSSPSTSLFLSQAKCPQKPAGPAPAPPPRVGYSRPISSTPDQPIPPLRKCPSGSTLGRASSGLPFPRRSPVPAAHRKATGARASCRW